MEKLRECDYTKCPDDVTLAPFSVTYFDLFFVVLVLLFFTNKRQRLGDLMARTIVVMKNPQPPKQQENQEDSPSG